MMDRMCRAALIALAWSGCLAAAVPAASATGCGSHPWCDSHLTPAQRAAMVVSAMTPAEELALVANGQGGDPRLGIPPLRGIDGPNGIGEGNTHVTAFPDAETLAAAFDPPLAAAYGRALGAEANGKGYDWLFAPTVNIVRTPKWGREAETLGEDPFLTASLVAPEIRGIQSQHVISEVKHYAGNNQEVDRFGQPLGGDAVSDQVSERALQEIYLPGFKAAVQQGHVGSVMCSYNRINLVYSCQSPRTIATLKGFGLNGFVGPDALLAVRDDVTAANAGVDNFQLGSLASATGGNDLTILTDAFNSGGVSAARLRDMAQRILIAMFAVGVVDHPSRGSATASVSTRAHLRLATQTAEQATVLLENRHRVLPLRAAGESLAVIGPDAGAGTQIEENGSPAVRHGPVIAPLAGIRRLVAGRSRVSYSPGTLGDVPLPTIPSSSLTPSAGGGHGLDASYYTGQSPTGQPVLTRIDPTVDFASAPAPLTPIPDTPDATAAVWTGTLTPPVTGIYRFSIAVAGVASLSVAGHLVVDANAEFAAAHGGQISDPGAPTITFQGQLALVKGHPVPVRVQYATGSSIGGAALQVGWEPPDPGLIARAVRAARHARVAVVFANDVTSEGMDRTSLQLPGDQDRMISAIAAANPRTIVVLHTAGPVLMPWLPKVAGVIEAWYPGQQSGTAIAATLFGRVDPGGRLPVTFPATADQGAATQPSQYPGIGNQADYSEGIFVGYRFYDEHHQRPLFPFGYGLSYTTFGLRALRVRGAGGRERVTVIVRNTGRRAGTDVVQLYVGFPRGSGEPPHQLKAYAKLALAAGRSRTVTLGLTPSSFSAYATSAGRFVVRPGSYRISLGQSSRDLQLSTMIRLR